MPFFSNRKIYSLFVFLSFVIAYFIKPVSVNAQQCGSGSSQEVTSCLRINGQCYSDPSTQINHTYTCSTQLPGGNGTCQGVVIGAGCYDDGRGGCEVRGAGTYVIISCGGGGGSGCFVPGTTIRSSTGGKKIENIKVGDNVTSFDDKTNQIKESSVINLHKVNRDFYFSIIAGGYHVEVTAEHPFYIGNGEYKEAQYLKPGDVLYVDENNALVYKVVAANIRINEPTPAYNLTVNNTHTFFANDFAVHNKGNCNYTYSCAQPDNPPDCDDNKDKVDSSNCPGGCEKVGPKAKQCAGADKICIGVQQNCNPINGSCGATHWNCAPGNILGTQNEETSYYSWWCNGTDGGTDAFCTELKPIVCTAPVITSIVRNSSTNATVNWTPGTGGTNQHLYFGSSQAAVNSNCAGGTCTDVVLGQGIGSYTATLATGTVYYFKVLNGTGCNIGSALYPYLSSCNVSPSSLQMITNSTDTLQTVVNTDSSNQITRVTFSSSNTGIATVTSPDATSPYTTTVTSGSATGSTTVTSDVYFGSTIACTGQGIVNVAARSPWWQVQDADVGTNGSLNSQVPSPKFFGLPRVGGYPGVPMYAESTNLDATNVSASPTPWIANTSISVAKIYDSAFFKNQIPTTTVINSLDSNANPASLIQSGDGYYWFRYDGALNGNLPLSINAALNVGSMKMIVLVDNADFNINKNISLTDGQGFFLAIVSGNIKVDPTVTSMEGIYETDKQFSTGVGTAQLHVRGSVAAYGGVLLTGQRDLGNPANSTTPSELFEYAPDQIMLFPKTLSVRRIKWKEVAP